MVISCSTCQKEENKCPLVKYVIYPVLPLYYCVIIYAIFPPNPNSPIFRTDKKITYCSSGYVKHNALINTDTNADQHNQLTALRSRVVR